MTLRAAVLLALSVLLLGAGAVVTDDIEPECITDDCVGCFEDCSGPVLEE